MAITIVTILGIVVYLYKTCSKMSFFKEYLYDNVCIVYLFISHDCYHVPLKLRELKWHFTSLYPEWKAQGTQYDFAKAFFVGYNAHEMDRHYPKYE